MTDFKKAIVVGGFGQTKKVLEPLAEAIGTHTGFNLNETPDIATLGYALRHNRKLNREAERRLVFALSYGPMAVHCAGAIVVLNGVEPTSLDDQKRGAKITSSQEFKDEMGREPHVPELGDAAMYLEFAKHPLVTVMTPFRIRHASSLQKLIDGGTEAYPGGRAYFPGEDDEFGFGSNGEVERARQNDITAAMFPGYHGQALYYPQATAERIYQHAGNILR